MLLSIFIPYIASAQETADRPQISDSIVMFYYPDISAVREFYEQTLGLKASLEDDWVRIYPITPNTSLGIVQQGPGAFHKANPDSAVMLSIVTPDVDAWCQRLKAARGVRFEHELSDHNEPPIRAFLVRDPGGYTIEFSSGWIDSHLQTT